MRYHIEFADTAGQRYTLEGVKYMQKNSATPGDRRCAWRLHDALHAHLPADARWNQQGDRHRLHEVPHVRESGGGFESGRASWPPSRSRARAIRRCNCRRACGLSPSRRSLWSENTIRSGYRLSGLPRISGPGFGPLWYAPEPGGSRKPYRKRELGGNPSTSPVSHNCGVAKGQITVGKLLNIRRIRYCMALRAVIDSS